MIAWNLGPHDLTVMKGNDGENVVVWQEDVVWQWRHESPAARDRRVTGEFSVGVPPEWSSTGGPAHRQFVMTANAYVAPGQAPRDDGVHLEDYDPLWPGLFDEFADWLRECLGPDVALNIEHFGSTSIPGMIAKPVIDVLVEVPSFPEAKQRALPLLNTETWEYWWYQNHMMFVKRDRLMGLRTHHLHMMPEGLELRKRLALRDYLRSHAEDASHYAILKRQLAGSHHADREHYTDAKAAFVTEIVAKAMATPNNAACP